MGLGVLGSRVAQALRAFEFPVLGWSRGPKALDGVRCHHGPDGLHDFLAGTQVLVVPYGYNEGRDVRELDVDGIVDTLVNAAQWVELWNQNQNAAKAQA